MYKVLKTSEFHEFFEILFFKNNTSVNNILKSRVKRESERPFDVIIMKIFIQQLDGAIPRINRYPVDKYYKN